MASLGEAVKIVGSALLGAFGVGAYVAKLNARVASKASAEGLAQTRKDVNALGATRVKKVEEDMKILIGRVDEQREQDTTHREQAFEREATLRERVAKLEASHDAILDLLRAERAGRD